MDSLNCNQMLSVESLLTISVIPEYDGRVTVPVLWDKKEKKVINNESSEIIRILNHEFNDFCQTTDKKELDFYPKLLRRKIDKINAFIYE